MTCRVLSPPPPGRLEGRRSSCVRHGTALAARDVESDDPPPPRCFLAVIASAPLANDAGTSEDDWITRTEFGSLSLKTARRRRPPPSSCSSPIPARCQCAFVVGAGKSSGPAAGNVMAKSQSSRRASSRRALEGRVAVSSRRMPLQANGFDEGSRAGARVSVCRLETLLAARDVLAEVEADEDSDADDEDDDDDDVDSTSESSMSCSRSNASLVFLAFFLEDDDGNRKNCATAFPGFLFWLLATGVAACDDTAGGGQAAQSKADENSGDDGGLVLPASQHPPFALLWLLLVIIMVSRGGGGGGATRIRFLLVTFRFRLHDDEEGGGLMAYRCCRFRCCRGSHCVLSRSHFGSHQPPPAVLPIVFGDVAIPHRGINEKKGVESVVVGWWDTGLNRRSERRCERASPTFKVTQNISVTAVFENKYFSFLSFIPEGGRHPAAPTINGKNRPLVQMKFVPLLAHLTSSRQP
jgi:hypothetical protein